MWRAETLLRKKANNIHCVVHETSAEWFLVEEINEFHFDGFALISKQSVKRSRYNRFDKVFDKILRSEGATPSKPPLSVEGSSQEIFTRLSEIDTLVTVEADDESCFLIGKIHRMTSDRLFMKHFSADGKWFERPTGIDFSVIGRACFCDEYREWMAQIPQELTKHCGEPGPRAPVASHASRRPGRCAWGGRPLPRVTPL